MEKREILLYTLTVISLIAFVYIALGAVSKIPNISDKKLMSLTGNVVLNLEGNYKIGDKLNGELIIDSNEFNRYGVLLLTKDNKPVLTETFNLKDISKSRVNSNQYSVKISNLTDYKFEEKGNYELMFFVPDLNINIKKKFVVE
jgi:hypothetical protein